MKLPLNWLKDYIDVKLSTEEIVERLTMAGLEIEAVEAIAGDTVLEIEITPNRPDCLSILGLGREVSAITGKSLKCPTTKSFKKPFANPIHIEDKNDCGRYIATLIRNVNIAPSTKEIRQRLASVGINAINNAVDVTNFVLMEMGQPLHVFDYDKLAGGQIVVRRAKEGERIITLDGIERQLDPSILVIADARKPVAIAGIMGGRDTQITGETKNILLESAHFDMGIVRRACRTLGLRSDSSYRFERNVNVSGVLTGADRATQLLLEFTGGQLAGRAEIFVKTKTPSVKIQLTTQEVESLLGIKVTPSKIKAWLTKLGFKVTAEGQKLAVVAPDGRGDIRQSVDVIEEIARMIGFDKLPMSLPMIPMANITVDLRPWQVKAKMREVLTARGLDETITHSMVSRKDLERCQIPMQPLRVFNPLSQDQEFMRPALLPSLLPVVRANFNRGQKDLRFFEIGRTYSIDGEKQAMAILLCGRRRSDWRDPLKSSVDIYDLKGLVEIVFQIAGADISYAESHLPTFEAASRHSIIMDGKTIGMMGQVSQDVLKEWDIKSTGIFFAAFYLDDALAKAAPRRRYKPVSEFPAIVRDVSLSVKKEISYQRIEQICRQHGGDILGAVHFIEEYTGEKIQPGQRGLVFSCQYQSDIRTLREDEVSAVHENIVRALIQEIAAVRR